MLFKSLLLVCLLGVCFWITSFDWKPNPYSSPERGLVEYEAFLARWAARGEKEFAALGSDSSLSREQVVGQWRERGAAQFREFDLNGDGVLDKKERKQMNVTRKQATTGGS